MFRTTDDLPLRRLRSVSRAVKSDRAAKFHQSGGPAADSNPPPPITISVNRTDHGNSDAVDVPCTTEAVPQNCCSPEVQPSVALPSLVVASSSDTTVRATLIRRRRDGRHARKTSGRSDDRKTTVEMAGDEPESGRRASWQPTANVQSSVRRMDARLKQWRCERNATGQDDVGGEPNTTLTKTTTTTNKMIGRCRRLARMQECEKPTRSPKTGAKSTCLVCRKDYDIEYMKVHARVHSGEKPFDCAACSETFSTRNQNRIHFQRHHGDVAQLECDVCHRLLASKASLKEHKRTHSSDKPYSCDQCDKKFKQLSLLSQHIKSHRPELPFQCPLCSRRYKTKRSMQRHQQAIHEGVRLTFQCEVCGKVFGDSTALRDHGYQHDGNSPHICSYCGRKFLSRKVLNLHILIHEKKKPYQCEQCGLTFRQRCVLKRHLSVHTGIKWRPSQSGDGVACSYDNDPSTTAGLMSCSVVGDRGDSEHDVPLITELPHLPRVADARHSTNCSSHESPTAPGDGGAGGLCRSDSPPILRVPVDGFGEAFRACTERLVPVGGEFASGSPRTTEFANGATFSEVASSRQAPLPPNYSSFNEFDVHNNCASTRIAQFAESKSHHAVQQQAPSYILDCSDQRPDLVFAESRHDGKSSDIQIRAKGYTSFGGFIGDRRQVAGEFVEQTFTIDNGFKVATPTISLNDLDAKSPPSTKPSRIQDDAVAIEERYNCWRDYEHPPDSLAVGSMTLHQPYKNSREIVDSNRTMLERNRNIPDNIQVMADNVGIIPDNIRTIPENNRDSAEVIRENTIITPENNRVILKNNRVILEDNPAIREHHRDIPNNNRVIPENNLITPDNDRVVPKDNRVIPENNRVIQESNRSVSKNIPVAAQNIRVISEPILNAPNNPDISKDIQVIPECFRDVSKRALTTPQTNLNTSRNFRAVPETNRDISTTQPHYSSDSEDVIPSVWRPLLDDDDSVDPDTRVLTSNTAVAPTSTITALAKSESEPGGATADTAKKPRVKKRSSANRWLFRKVTTLAQCKIKLQKKLLNSKIYQTRESSAVDDTSHGLENGAGPRAGGVTRLYRIVSRHADISDPSATTTTNTTTTTKKRAKRVFSKVDCSVCGKNYDVEYLKLHMRSHTHERPFSCNDCSQTFATGNQLRMHHLRSHGDVAELECDVCHRVLASKASLKEHKRTHSSDKPFSCTQCEAKFKQLSLLSQHVKSHLTEQAFQCELCGNRYKSKRGMERHRRSAHEGLRPVHNCALCDKIFGDSTALRDHVAFCHEGNTLHECSYCGRKFQSRKILQMHVLIHEDKKPFACTYPDCGKAFRQRCVLVRHMSVHSGIKPFQCDKCNRGFIHAVYLRRHSCAAEAPEI